MTPQDVLGQSELSADEADLVLEEPLQRLDDLERHHFRQTAHVVVGLDAGARLRFARSRLDHVGIDRPLHKKALAIAAFGDEAFLPCRALERSDELLPDERALPPGCI